MQIIKIKANEAKISCGIHIVQPSISEMQQKIDDGYRFIAYSIDSVFLNKIVHLK